MRNPLVQAVQQATDDLPGTWNRFHVRRDVFVLWRRKWTVALVALAALATALAFSVLQTPVYGASAELLLQSRRSEQLFSPEGVQLPDVRRSRIQTELRVIGSRSVRDEVARLLGREPHVSIRALGETDVVVLSARGNDAVEAAREVNVYAETYISVRRKQLVDDLTAGSAEVQAKANEIEEQIRELDEPLVALETRIASLDSQMIGSQPATQRQIIAERTQVGEQVAAQRRQIEGLEDQLSKYSEQLDQLQLASNLTQTGGAQIVSRAVPDKSPIRPRPVRDSVLALLAGLAAGGCLAFWRERTDTTMRDQEELEAETQGIDLLGTIPLEPGARWGTRSRGVVSLTDPTSPLAEAYRGLRTSFQLLPAGRPSLTLQFTSPGPGDGKTSMVTNLGVALARTGQRVAVVDLDLRRPRLHKLFDVDNSVGMTSLLRDENLALPHAVRKGRVDGGSLSVLPAGPPPSNPGELLASPRIAKILAELQTRNEFVLVDSAPTLSVADALVLTTFVDGTVVVVRAGKTTRKDVRRTLKRLQQVAATVVGVVMNGVDTDLRYGYHYGHPPNGRSTRRSRSRNGSKGKAPQGRGVATTVAREDRR